MLKILIFPLLLLIPSVNSLYATEVEVRHLNVTAGITLIPIGVGATSVGQSIAGTFSIASGVILIVKSDEIEWKIQRQIILAENEIRHYLLTGELKESVIDLLNDIREQAQHLNIHPVLEASDADLAVSLLAVLPELRS